MTNFTRRDALKLTAAGAVTLALPTFALGAVKKTQPKISLQLYSVRKDCGKDIDATMEKVAKMGYQGVEFAGYYKYGSKPKELKKKLDSLGLVAAGTHIRTNSFIGDALKKTADFHAEIGCKYLICPGDGMFTNKEKSKELAEIYTKAAEYLKPLGMHCGFHNHKSEFNKDGDKMYWELFAERTPKEVVLQLDAGWAFAAGQDPVKLIKQFPGRTGITHFKPAAHDGGKDYIGQDNRDWGAVYKACCDFGGTEWVTIEQERYPDGKSPLECSKISLEGLKKIIG